MYATGNHCVVFATFVAAALFAALAAFAPLYGALAASPVSFLPPSDQSGFE
ncbi:MAG: hypothetical protein N2444_01275 [Methylocystis sp.]|nr:hypothetical protein [Methylocystis sp.]